MLTNEQIDQMEQMIYFAEPDEVMEVLSKLIPVLFAELRITRGTLDSKVSQFLGEVNEQHPTPTNAGDAPADTEPVRQQQDVDPGDKQSVQPQPDSKGSDEGTKAPSGRKKNKGRPAAKGGTRKKKRSNKKVMDTRTGQAEIRRAGEGVKKKSTRKRSKPDVAVVKEEDIEFPDLS